MLPSAVLCDVCSENQAQIYNHDVSQCKSVTKMPVPVFYGVRHFFKEKKKKNKLFFPLESVKP